MGGNTFANHLLRLPKLVEVDQRGANLLQNLITHTRPLWRESGLWIPAVRLDIELAEALKKAHRTRQMIRGLESAEQALAAEERGLRMADRQSGVTRGVRVSRLLILSKDGAKRFYRNIETMLRRHGPRVLAVRLEINEKGLGELLFGPNHVARLVMLEHKKAVASVLLAMAGQWADFAPVGERVAGTDCLEVDISSSRAVDERESNDPDAFEMRNR